MYTCLPLYPGAGHGLCFVPSIGAGSAICLSRKFSHKTFWPEVTASKSNIIQYVGELCRYLINAPPGPLDKAHCATMAWGNGMRPDVWEPFRERFNIECINELYAATDGLGSSFNANRGPFGRNAIAVRGLMWDWTNGANEKRVKIDPDSQELLRDKDGFCITCKKGEAGEVLHRIPDPELRRAAFTGYYNNDAASEKRFIGDVFKKGDMWFRSGDMHRQEKDGCVYFVDRLGDTFRWHSENVSTNEVSDVMGQYPQIAEANVYGVLVPHADGRAGCAAIVPTQDTPVEKFDFAALAEHALNALPRYAVPIFIRLVRELEYTGTMKLQKGRLRGEGIEPEKIRQGAEAKGEKVVDQMYWLPPGERRYMPFGPREWEEVKAGRVRL
jgi:acyl-CoA synthetase (AMP-forming)/AMP-acid ligase II